MKLAIAGRDYPLQSTTSNADLARWVEAEHVSKRHPAYLTCVTCDLRSTAWGARQVFGFYEKHHGPDHKFGVTT